MRIPPHAKAILFSCLFYGVADAQPVTWVGPAQGSWSVPGNWTGGTIPPALADVVIDGGAPQNSAVTLDVPAQVRSVTVTDGDSLTVSTGLTLSFGQAASILGPGVLRIGTSAGGAQVSSPGTINLLGGGTVELPRFGRINANLLMNQVDRRIVGVGEVSSFSHNIGTAAFIEARAPAGAAGLFATLNVTATDRLLNDGTMSAAPGATLSIGTGRVLLGGTIHAAHDSTVTFTRDMSIEGGRLSSIGSGVLMALPSDPLDRFTLQNVTLDGRLVSHRAETRVLGSLDNRGTLALTTPRATLQLGPGTTPLFGGGAVQLTGQAMLGSATATLHQAGHAIRGFTSATGLSVGTIINVAGGIIEADVPGERFVVAPGSALGNSGLLSATNGGELLLAGTAPLIDNRFGRIVARGSGSRVLINRTTRIFGGTIESEGDGQTVFDAPAGTLTLDNTVNLGRLQVQSGTLAAGTGGLINPGTISTGTINIAGTITLLGSGQFNVGGRVSGGRIVNLGNRIGGSGFLQSELENLTGGIVDVQGTGLSLPTNTINSGLIRASNGGTLFINAANNTGGRLEAATGSSIRVSGLISNGTVAALAGGSIVPNTFGVTLRGGLTLLGPGTFGVADHGPFQYILNDGQSIAIGDNPVLDSGTFTITGSTTLNFAGGQRAVTMRNLSFNAGAATLHTFGGTLNLQGQLTNRANIDLGGSSDLAGRIAPVGVATLSGGGTIHRARGAPSTGRLINLDNTIFLDSAFFGLWDGGWENYGTLRAGSSHAHLSLKNTATSVNRGLIQTDTFNRLDITSSGTVTMPAVLDNAGGIIRATGGGVSRIVMENLRIRGGLIDATNGRIHPSNTGTLIFSDLSIAGIGVNTATGRLRFEDFITLQPNAVVTVGDPFSDGGQLITSNLLTLTGPGDIRVLPRGTIAGSGRITLQNVRIFGAGTVGGNSAGFVIDSDSAIIARPLPGVEGAMTMHLLPGNFGITNNGALVVENGARMLVNTGSLQLGTISGSAGSIHIHNGGVFESSILILSGLVRNDGTVIVTHRQLSAGTLDGTGVVQVSGGNVIAGRFRQDGATLLGSGELTLNGPGVAGRVNQLTMSSGARLNLEESGLVIDYDTESPLNDIRAWVIGGYAGGSWNGTGIRSALASFPPRRVGIGYAEATEVGLAGGTFLSQAVDSTGVLLRYTLQGDADLTGTVDVADFARLATNFNQAAHWSGGDFDYDGMAGIGDFSRLASNFNRVLTFPTARSGVPEPVGAVWLAGTSLWLSRSRRLRRAGE